MLDIIPASHPYVSNVWDLRYDVFDHEGYATTGAYIGLGYVTIFYMNDFVQTRQKYPLFYNMLTLRVIVVFALVGGKHLYDTATASPI